MEREIQAHSTTTITCETRKDDVWGSCGINASVCRMLILGYYQTIEIACWTPGRNKGSGASICTQIRKHLFVSEPDDKGLGSRRGFQFYNVKQMTITECNRTATRVIYYNGRAILSCTGCLVHFHRRHSELLNIFEAMHITIHVNKGDCEYASRLL